MSVMQFINGNISTTALNSQLASDLLLTPNGQTGFPSAPRFTILERQSGELMLVTAVGATWTIQRGYGGTSAHPITAGDSLDYSITREMLLGGFTTLLDQQALSVDTAAAVVALTIPTGLPQLSNLRLKIQAGATTDAYLQIRFNNDSSANYDNNYAYFGSSSSSGQWNGLTFGRFWTGNQAIPQIGSDVDLEIGSPSDADRWKTWTIRQWLRQSSGAQFIMLLSGAWKPVSQAAISTIQISCDISSNGVWAAGTLRSGFKASLYGSP